MEIKRNEAPHRKYSDKELCELIVKVQEKDPLFSDANICKELDVSHDYLYDREKKSPLVAAARKKVQAIRETAWVARGIDGMVNQSFNATVYIWMTRNMLKWRDKEHLQIDLNTTNKIAHTAQEIELAKEHFRRLTALPK